MITLCFSQDYPAVFDQQPDPDPFFLAVGWIRGIFFTGSDQIFIYTYNCYNVHDKIDFSDFYFKAPKSQIWFLKMYTYSKKGVHMFLPLDPDPFKN